MAVVGAGYWGPNLVRNAQATPQFALRWLCDLDQERAETVLGAYSSVSTTTSYDQVLDDPEVQAVAIATPAATHFDLVRAALEAGKHVLVEKPLTPSLDEGRKLVELAERQNRVLMLDHTYCYTPAVRHIRDMLHSGELGKLQFIDSVRINLGLVQPDVDVVWDLAPHDLSILDFVLPSEVRPVSVAALGSDPIGAGHSCVAYLAIVFDTGAMAHVHVNWLSPVKIRTSVFGGSARTVVWDDLNPSQRVAVYDRGVDRQEAESVGPEERRRTQVSYRIGDMVAPALPETEALRGVMAEFAAACAEGRPALTDGRSGLRVLALLEAASRSLENGGAPVAVEEIL